MIKILFSCPKTHTLTILKALEGFGPANGYDSWARITPCTEQFRPLAGSQPYLGKIGEVTQVESDKVELLCGPDEWEALVAQIRQHHPYQTPAIEVWPLIHP